MTQNFPIKFGFCVPIFALPSGLLFRTPNFPTLDTAAALNMARLADELGYDSLWVADHLMLGKDAAILEGWTTLAALAGSTQQAELGIIHQAHFFRHPTLAAKMIATLDQISGGRFIYFIDTGTRPGEHQAYGLPYPDTLEERMPYLLEGLTLAQQLWQSSEDNPVTFAGQYYHVTDAVCTPHPVRTPPVWFGEAHPVTLNACARHGQGWNSVPVPHAELQHRLEALRAACSRMGRDYDTLEKTLEIQILIAPDTTTLRQTLNAIVSKAPPDDPRIEGLDAYLAGRTDKIPVALADTWLIGTPAAVRTQIQRYLDLGFTHFMLWFVDAPETAGLHLFSEQIAPFFKETDHSTQVSSA